MDKGSQPRGSGNGGGNGNGGNGDVTEVQSVNLMDIAQTDSAVRDRLAQALLIATLLNAAIQQDNANEAATGNNNNNRSRQSYLERPNMAAMLNALQLRGNEEHHHDNRNLVSGPILLSPAAGGGGGPQHRTATAAATGPVPREGQQSHSLPDSPSTPLASRGLSISIRGGNHNNGSNSTNSGSLEPHPSSSSLGHQPIPRISSVWVMDQQPNGIAVYRAIPVSANSSSSSVASSPGRDAGHAALAHGGRPMTQNLRTVQTFNVEALLTMLRLRMGGPGSSVPPPLSSEAFAALDTRHLTEELVAKMEGNSNSTTINTYAILPQRAVEGGNSRSSGGQLPCAPRDDATAEASFSLSAMPPMPPMPPLPPRTSSQPGRVAGSYTTASSILTSNGSQRNNTNASVQHTQEAPSFCTVCQRTFRAILAEPPTPSPPPRGGNGGGGSGSGRGELSRRKHSGSSMGDSGKRNKERQEMKQKLSSSVTSSIVLMQLVRLPCQHVFCESCLTEWLRRTSTCPNCRYGLANTAEAIEKQYCHLIPSATQGGQESKGKEEGRVTITSNNCLCAPDWWPATTTRQRPRLETYVTTPLGNAPSSTDAARSHGAGDSAHAAGGGGGGANARTADMVREHQRDHGDGADSPSSGPDSPGFSYESLPSLFHDDEPNHVNASNHANSNSNSNSNNNNNSDSHENSSNALSISFNAPTGLLGFRALPVPAPPLTQRPRSHPRIPHQANQAKNTNNNRADAIPPTVASTDDTSENDDFSELRNLVAASTADKERQRTDQQQQQQDDNDSDSDSDNETDETATEEDNTSRSSASSILDDGSASDDDSASNGSSASEEDGEEDAESEDASLSDGDDGTDNMSRDSGGSLCDFAHSSDNNDDEDSDEDSSDDEQGIVDDGDEEAEQENVSLDSADDDEDDDEEETRRDRFLGGKYLGSLFRTENG